MTRTTIETITDEQIERLLREAASAADQAMVAICLSALRLDPLVSAAEGGTPTINRERLAALRRVEDPRAECARFIAEAEVQS